MISIGKLNPFRNLKTTHKLFLALMVTLAGFVITYFAYMLLQQSLTRLQTQNETLEEFVQAGIHAKLDVIDSERLLGDFLITRNPAYLKQFKDAINRANNGTATLEKLAQNEEQQQLIYQGRDAVSAYQRAALLLVDNEMKMGLDENSGLREGVRTATHALEAALTKTQGSEQAQKSADLLRLETLYLQLRRAEKDFVERGKSEELERFAKYGAEFGEAVRRGGRTAEQQAEFMQLLSNYQEKFAQLVQAAQQRPELLKQMKQAQDAVDPLVDSMIKITRRAAAANKTQAETIVTQSNQIYLLVFLGIAVLVTTAISLIAWGIIRSMRNLRRTVLELAENDAQVDTTLKQGNEFVGLAKAFDAILDLRQTQLLATERANEQLNDSVVQLMDAADRLSRQDLTVIVPVNEDVTGNIGDALNLMTRETARTMREINDLAARLEAAAATVREQGDKVAEVATTERQVVAQVLDKLNHSTTTMTEMAQLASNCDALAANASKATKQALLTVRDTVQSIDAIRSSVSETEKSIKRLGERSQEIGGIVEIIKDIAERTHMLALNAGMQAVAAGEAGRGFSVVADEVQRLAETARESTEQIAALVQSIQAESSETMATMNKTISQVVQGSELAGKAGKRMRRTQQHSQELVTAVQQIAEHSKIQETITSELHDQAAKLEQSTTATEGALREQTTQTENLFRYLSNLVKSVRVFKLPEAA